MKIYIEYDSCWQTSFLGDDDKRPIRKNDKRPKTNFHSDEGFMQKFVATSGSRGEKNSSITDSTVLGVLCRLVGDQRKLYQSRGSKNFYFSDVEDKISWQLPESKSAHELVYLTNKSDDRCGQGTWLGVLPDDNPWFFSENSRFLWCVLFADLEGLIKFILCDKPYERYDIGCTPKNLIKRINILSDTNDPSGAIIKTQTRLISDKTQLIEKKKTEIIKQRLKNEDVSIKSQSQIKKNQEKMSVLLTQLQVLEEELAIISTNENKEFYCRLDDAVQFLSIKYPNSKKVGEEYCSNGLIYPLSLYSAALYLQAERLLKKGIAIDFVKDSNGEIQIQGFSKRGFNGIRDWLNRMSGGRKKSVGTPCQINKQSGQLEITIDVDRQKAQEIKDLIENAGVSAFYLGKKGLAYVSDIRL